MNTRIMQGAGVWLAIAVFQLSGATYAASTSKPVTVTDADNRKEITLDPGQTFIVQLPENPSTGMSWGMTEVSGGVLKPKGKPVDHVEEGTAIGKPGTRTWTFVATGAKTSSVQQTLRFEYRQWFSKDFDAPGTVIFYHVVVRAKEDAR